MVNEELTVKEEIETFRKGFLWGFYFGAMTLVLVTALFHYIFGVK